MKYIIGAYASAPSLGVHDKKLECDFYDKLIDLIPEMRGLEIPYFGNGIHCFGSDFLLSFIKPDWDNVLSCIPGTMSELAKNKKFGLASDDEEGRFDAIAMHKRANQMLQIINNKFSRQSIIAVQIATAPSTPVAGVSSSMASFLQSMREILSWDWCGAKIVIEHCDTYILGQTFEKGFFMLDKEIEAITELSDQYNLGVTINWGRSAIEGRTPSKPVEHLKLVSKKELLAGLIFSGVSNNDQFYGEWKDTHMPFAESFDNPHCTEKSLLTESNIINSLNEISLDDIDYLGVKLLSMPIDKSTVDRRVEINRNAISVLQKIIL